MSETVKLEPEGIYHVYNRGVNKCKIFSVDKTYHRFLNSIFKYLPKVCNIYAWALMSNHFHFLLEIKDKDKLQENKSFSEAKTDEEFIKIINNQFSNLFNSYARYFNLFTSRSGPLYDSRFNKIPVESDEYFKRLIVYIHNNPVRHGFCRETEQYKWSSYHYYLNENQRLSFMNRVIEDFGGIEKFKKAHLEYDDKLDPEKDFI